MYITFYLISFYVIFVPSNSFHWNDYFFSLSSDLSNSAIYLKNHHIAAAKTLPLPPFNNFSNTSLESLIIRIGVVLNQFFSSLPSPSFSLSNKQTNNQSIGRSLDVFYYNYLPGRPCPLFRTWLSFRKANERPA